MTTRLVRIQLFAFALVTILAVGYGTVNLFHIGAIFSPPFEVRAEFATSGGIYQRADVDLLGTRVGSVSEIVPGPGSGTTVVMSLDNGVRIPRDVRAAVGNKSAIGEQYIELTPVVATGQMLADGDVIGLNRTSTPIDVAALLHDLSGLAGSIPTKDLSTVMSELSTGLSGVGGTLGTLIDNTHRLTKVSLDNAASLNTLIDKASIVLDTQVAQAPQTASYLHSLAGLTGTLRSLDPTFGSLFVDGLQAGSQVSGLLADNRQALPLLLNQLVSVATVASDRIPALRKTLVLFPWALEVGATGVRRCENYNAQTGQPIQATCQYDSNGQPIYSAYLGVQLSEAPGSPPYFPCTQGYQGTTKYLPNGVPLKGGTREARDSAPNMQAGCTALPTDPNTPNVRGSQNVIGPGVGWLLNSPMS